MNHHHHHHRRHRHKKQTWPPLPSQRKGLRFGRGGFVTFKGGRTGMRSLHLPDRVACCGEGGRGDGIVVVSEFN
ncbi:hypothetical protein E2C01_076583 [Portunus trituberculatus]|uniref:Uncharacterized protein n=1 Tax=Portunus trituberculatus TaxID=210409 RepID=A0A5B7IDK9_PORTR|nr:hypothetical protein [Portunus trituberculatus]